MSNCMLTYWEMMNVFTIILLNHWKLSKFSVMEYRYIKANAQFQVNLSQNLPEVMQ